VISLAVVSGKGGTGKTTIATSLFLSLENAQLIDADVDEPNCSLFLDIKTEYVKDAQVPIPVIDSTKCILCGECVKNCEYNALANLPNQILVFDRICHGCGVCSVVCPTEAITEKNRSLGKIFSGTNEKRRFDYGELIVGEELSTPIISTLKEQIDEEKDYVIFDSPPGSACPMVEAVIDVDYVIVVAEPTPFGLSDMKVVVETLYQLNKKFGVIINKEGIGNEELENYCREKGIAILFRIPFDMKIAKSYSVGNNLLKTFPEWKGKFQKIIKEIAEEVKNE